MAGNDVFLHLACPARDGRGATDEIAAQFLVKPRWPDGRIITPGK
jgi:hypothetical protein